MRVLQICIEGRPIASKIGAKSQFWSVEGEAVKVEDLALQHYAAEEHGSWQGRPSSYIYLGSCSLNNYARCNRNLQLWQLPIRSKASLFLCDNG